MSNIDYSIIVPVYKSTATLKQLCDEIHVVFSGNNLSYELILVNDASPDDTWNVVKEIKATSSAKVTAINLAKNTGQHHALLCGFQYATGKFVVTIDDDLQFSPNDILLLIKHQELTQADLVYGMQFIKEHSTFRNFGSRVVAYMFSSFASTPGRGSSFRLISTNIIQQIKNFNHRYIFLDELLAWFTSNTQFVEVTHNKRKEGKSGYTLGKLILWTLRIVFAYTTLPLRIMTYFGILTFLVCLSLVIYFIYQKENVGAELGFTALITSIFMSTGLILFCLGIIGEYLNRLFHVQHKRPVFFIKEVL
jgi:glycosyltransferase involved in cell wall biosynthesis